MDKVSELDFQTKLKNEIHCVVGNLIDSLRNRELTLMNQVDLLWKEEQLNKRLEEDEKEDNDKWKLAGDWKELQRKIDGWGKVVKARKRNESFEIIDQEKLAWKVDCWEPSSRDESVLSEKEEINELLDKVENVLKSTRKFPQIDSFVFQFYGKSEEKKRTLVKISPFSFVCAESSKCCDFLKDDHGFNKNIFKFEPKIENFFERGNTKETKEERYDLKPFKFECGFESIVKADPKDQCAKYLTHNKSFAFEIKNKKVNEKNLDENSLRQIDTSMYVFEGGKKMLEKNGSKADNNFTPYSFYPDSISSNNSFKFQENSLDAPLKSCTKEFKESENKIESKSGWMVF